MQFFTTIFEDGFESGDFSNWSSTIVTDGDTLQVIDTDSHHGSYCAEMGIDSPAADASYCRKYLGSSYSTIYVRVYIKIVSSTISSSSYVSFFGLRDYSEGKSRYYLIYRGDGALGLAYRSSGSWQGNHWSSTTITTEEWHCFEVKCVIDSSNGEYRVYYDGSEVTDLTVTNVDTTTGTNYSALRLGMAYNEGSGNIIFHADCVVVADTYIGEHEIFNDGFESGDFSAWDSTAGSPSVQSSVVNSGTYAMSASGTSNVYAQKTFTDRTTVYIRFYARWTALDDTPDATRPLRVCGNNGSSGLFVVRVQTSGISFYNVYGTNIGWHKYSTTMNADQWYCIEVKIKGGSDGEYRLWLDGTEVITLTEQNNSSMPDVDTIQVGLTKYSVTSTTVYIDDVIVADIYIGPISEVTEITVADSISLADAVLRHKTITLTDSVAALDSILGHKSFSLSDVIQTVEQILRSKSFSVSDSISLADAINVIKEILKTVIDSIQLSDSALAHRTLSIQDAVQIAEAILRGKSFTVSDSISLSDLINIVKEIVKTVSDNVSLSDSVLRHKTLAILDNISLSGKILRHKSFLIQDSVTLSETILRNKILEIQDQIALLESVIASKLFTIIDQISLTDAVEIVRIIKVIHDAVKLAEKILAHRELAIKDQIKLSDAITLIGFITRILKLILAEFLPVKINTQDFKPVTIATESLTLVNISTEEVVE